MSASLSREPGSPEALVEVRELRCSRGAFTLEIPSWSLPPGQVLGLVGPNGAGKTTLLRLLSGELRPEAGKVRVLGLDPVARLAEVRRQVGAMSDEQAVFRVSIGRLLRLLSGYHPTWDDALVEELLARFDLDPGRRTWQLSKGEGTRLRILLALAHRPRLVLLDEPGAGLDLGARRALLRTVLEVVGEGDRSVVISSHQLEDVARISDALLVLRGGAVVQQGPTDVLLGEDHSLEERLLSWGAAG